MGLPLPMIKAYEANRFLGCAACIMRFYAMAQYCCFTRINAMVRVPLILEFAQPTELLQTVLQGEMTCKLTDVLSWLSD